MRAAHGDEGPASRPRRRSTTGAAAAEPGTGRLTLKAQPWTLRLMTSVRRLLPVAFLVCAACPGDDGGDDDGASTTAPTTTAAGSSSGGGTPGSTSDTPDDSSGGPPGSTSSNDGSTSAGSSGSADSSGGSTGAAGVTWGNFAEGFFESYCWECHGAGDPLRDYTTIAGIMVEANAIRCGTAPVGAMLTGCEGEPPESQFPIGATIPTDDERATLVEWIDAGLPE